MHLRSRRAMIAVAAAASMILTVSAVPESPLSPSAAQAATASKTQDTNLDFRCNVYAGGGLGNENYDISTGMHVTMPESARPGEEFDVTIKIDPVSIVNEQAGAVGGQPSFEEGGTKANRIRFALSTDAELVESNLPGTTLNGRLLDVYGMMQPSKSGSKVTISYQELKLKLKAKSSGKLAIQTPKKYPKLDNLGRVSASNMVWGQGIAGKLFFKTPGLRVTCMTDQFKTLGATQVGKFAEVNEPKYADIEVKQQDTATSTDTSAAPAGTTYAKGAEAPEWATVGQDGTVTVNPGLDVKPGKYTVPVKVTYPDNSGDDTTVNVTVTVKPDNEIHDPRYADVTVKQQDTETVEPPKDVAEGAKFAAGEGAPTWAKVANDGTVTVNPGLDVAPGKYTVPVKVTYPDNSGDDTTVNVTVTVKPKNEIHDPKYSGTTKVEQESTATVTAPEGLPEGAKVTRGEGAPEWVTVNEDGSIEAKPTLETEAKDYTVPVVVTYDDGSTDEATAKVTVTKKPDNQIYSPEFGSITVQANRSAKTPAIEGLPEGTKFALAEGAPEWASIDDKGAVQLNPGGEVDAKDYTVPVTVTYPDGTIDNAELKVTVTERAINELHDPTYKPIEVKQEETGTVAAPQDSTADAEYALGTGAPNWVTLNKDGSLEARPGLEVKPGEYKIPVTVIYGDDSADRTTAVVTVTVKPANEIHDPTYSDVTVKQGDEVTAPAPTDVAEGATFEAGEGVPSWITVNPDGTVTAKPGTDVEAKEYTVPVKVSYKDGSGDDTTVNVTVTVKPANEIHDPSFEDVSVKPGETVTSKVPGDTGEGAKFTAGEGAPEWATVNEDGTVTLKPGKDVEPGEHNIPVVVTYPDGSTSTVELKVNVEKQENPSGSSGSSNGSSSSSGVTGSSPLGKFFAALFGTLVVGAGLFGLYNWARDHGYIR